MATQPTPVFILGSGRSGTTVTATLANLLPTVHIAKETGYIGLGLPLLNSIDDPGSLQQLVQDVNSWLQKEQWEHQASVEGFRAFCDRYQLTGGGAFLHYVWQLDSPVPWHELRVIGDNTPLYVMSIPAILKLLPDARFIHMVRDPRDVVCSICKMRFGAYDLVAASIEWHIYIGCWLMAARIISAENQLECRYEDLCASPKETFTQVARFLGCSDEQAVAAVEAHSSGGSASHGTFQKVANMAHHTRLNEPLGTSRIGRFRSELSQQEIRSVEEFAQFGMSAYGYSQTEWHTSPLVREDRLSYLKALLRDQFKRITRRIWAR